MNNGSLFSITESYYGFLQGHFYVNGLKSLEVKVTSLDLYKNPYGSYGDGKFSIMATKNDTTETILVINESGTHTRKFEGTDNYSDLYFYVYPLNDLVIELITITYDCTSFYNK